MSHNRTTRISLSRTPEYAAWNSMLCRCYNAKYREFGYYGGRGITVCDEWRNSFYEFLRDMGERPDGMSLDRIDTNGNYEPSNCRWATAEEQTRNRRSNVYITHNGETMILNDWATKLNISRITIKSRLRYGWSIAETLETPVRNRIKTPSNTRG